MDYQRRLKLFEAAKREIENAISRLRSMKRKSKSYAENTGYSKIKS